MADGGPRIIRTPDQRLRVFVSSTLAELADERAAVREAVTRLRLAPVMFELGARPHPPRDLYRAYLEQSHIFVGVYWQSYGWVAPGETISGLEDEYRLSGALPKLIYLKAPAPDREPRLAELLDRIRDDDQVSYKRFESAAELAELVESDLLVLLTEHFETAARGSGATAAARRGSLPVALDSFVGRADEIAAIVALLDEARLVTLVGPGGTGKTRLALRVGTDLLDRLDRNVHFVDLTPCRDVDAMLSATARALGVREQSDQPLLDDLAAAIGEQRMLLLLDNFEQVTVAAPAVAELLRDCAGLQVLVTSREALHVTGEHTFPVPPLGLPPADAGASSLEQLEQSEAIALFLERARSVKPDFALTDENAASVAELCVRLDGLPLAIELATARLALFSPEALVERLGNRLSLLRGGSRDAPARQQALRDTIDWSYELLDPADRRLFELVSVFSGATVDAVEAVARELSDVIEIDALEGLTSLLDKSLVRTVDRGPAGSRLTMLETIREFAAAKLAEDGAFHDAARRAHAAYFAHFTQRQWDALTGGEPHAASERLVADLDNIRAAWAYWVAAADLEQLAKLTDSLWFLYDMHSWYHSTVQLATDLLDVSARTPSTPERLVEQITLQTSLARLLLALHGYTEEVEEAYAHAIALTEGQEPVRELLPALRGLSSLYIYRAEIDKGLRLGEQILSLAERYDDAAARIEGHLITGTCLAMLDDLDAGREHLDAGIASYDPEHVVSSRFRLGNNPAVVCCATSALALWMLGYPDRARDRAHEGIVLAEHLDHPTSIAHARFHDGLLHLWGRDEAAARDSALRVVEIAEEHDFPIWHAVGSCILGAATAAVDSPEAGLAMMESAMDAYTRLKTPPVFLPMLLHIQARTCALAGRPADGLVLLDGAIELASEGTGATMTSEYLRLKGELLLAVSADNAAESERWFEAAVAAAAGGQARMLQLRAALGLSRLWAGQGREDDARALLAPLVGSFTEGFGTPDLVDARALLDGTA